MGRSTFDSMPKAIFRFILSTCMYHYHKYNDTPTIDREVDDYQPRCQLKKVHAENKVKTSDAKSVSTFADKYLVKPKLVLEYLQHLEAKEFRKENRRVEKHEKAKAAKNKGYNEYDWEELTRDENSLKTLRVEELNKYLNHNNLQQHIKSKKKEKIKTILQHWHSNTEKDGTLAADSRAHYESDGEEETDEENEKWVDVDDSDNEEVVESEE